MSRDQLAGDREASAEGGPEGVGAPDEPATPGPVLFARYAYPPNSLGYCGPSDPAALLEAASDGPDLDGLGRLAARFEGAWPYLQLIAACNGISDPLEARVVEAYWVGNELVDRVSAPALAASLSDRFQQPAIQLLESSMSAAPAGGVPQHSLHVFAVYPWLRLLRSGKKGPALEVLDRCRIRWGHVEAVTGDLVTVRSQVLSFDGSRLALGAERVEQARCSLDGVGPAIELRPGDTVSLHWDWVCDRLSPAALSWLQDCTLRNLAAVDAPPVPDPAVEREA
ncbi:MAG: DUF6390 family protein [Acidimicrobiales bacterium]